jgi:hypothetical protein
MVRRPFAIALAAALMINAAGTAYAQAPAATTKPAKPAAKPVVPEGLPHNIRIELTITDQAGPGEAAKRTVSMIVADRKNGSVRSSGQVMTPGGGGRFAVSLNVDAMPVILKEGLMRLDVTLEYVPKPGSDNASSGEGRGSLNERLSLLVESGKPLVVSQASDPTSDRKISIELTATILK